MYNGKIYMFPKALVSEKYPKTNKTVNIELYLIPYICFDHLFINILLYFGFKLFILLILYSSNFYCFRPTSNTKRQNL